MTKATGDTVLSTEASELLANIREVRDSADAAFALVQLNSVGGSRILVQPNV